MPDPVPLRQAIAELAVQWPSITTLTTPKERDMVHESHVKDRSEAWLTAAMLALGVLSAGCLAVSYTAQFVMVDAARGITAISLIEAGIPDVSMLIFACLGIAMALNGRRAIRARFLNLGAVATSVFMNYAAASHGWRNIAIWLMPPIAYALASDTAIGVVRAWAVARHKRLKKTLADDEATPLAIAGRAFLYVLRLVIAPPSTLKGGKQALLNATPLPGAPAARPQQDRKALPPAKRPKRKAIKGGTGKQARLIELAADKHDLAAIPQSDVSAIATGLAPEADLHPATARRVLLGHVRSLQSPDNEPSPNGQEPTEAAS